MNGRLPDWYLIFSFVVSAAALGFSALVLARLRKVFPVTVAVGLVTSILVMVGGAGYGLGWIDPDLWVFLGVVGRIIVLACMVWAAVALDAPLVHGFTRTRTHTHTRVDTDTGPRVQDEQDPFA